MLEQATEKGTNGGRSAPQHGGPTIPASAPRNGSTETAPQDVLTELFHGIWLAEDEDGAADARNGPVQSPGGIDQRTGPTAADRRSVLDQLTALPDGADVLGGVPAGIDDGKCQRDRAGFRLLASG